MKRTFFARAALAAVTMSLCGHRMPARGDDRADAAQLGRVQEDIDRLRLEDADRAIVPLLAHRAQDAGVRYARGELAFYRGDYVTAATLLSGAVGGSGRAATDLLAIATATRDATRAFRQARDRTGRYVVSYAPGPDELLVPYALDTLARADRAVTEELGVRHPGPIRLEIYDTPEVLSTVSSLSVDDIERTGTIALCKWDRLMITSPRALVRGYPWLDTIAHELVHLVLSRATEDHAPVWLQEGTAKLLERRWRGEPRHVRLEPPVRDILVHAVRTGRLLPFERLHPSIARLPNQEDAALAFGQVATFMDLAIRLAGPERWHEALAHLRQGADAREAMAQAAGRTFAELETEWKSELGVMAAAVVDGASVPLVGRRFHHGRAQSDESVDVSNAAAQTHVRVGDMLATRGHQRAAATEYERAFAAAPQNPIVACRYARSRLGKGLAQEALSALDAVAEDVADYEPAHAVRAAALEALGRAPEAVEASFEAIGHNPFDPAPHCGLARLAPDASIRTREEVACRTLSSEPPSP